MRSLPWGRARAYADLTLAMAISGSAVVVSKMMVSKIPVFLAVEGGLFFGLLILLPLVLIFRKESFFFDRRTHAVLFCQAVCGIFLYRIFTYAGLLYTSASASGLITSISPVLVVILARIFLKEKMALGQYAGLGLVVLGLLLIHFNDRISGGESNVKGYLLIFAAVFCEAVFSVLSKKKVMDMSPICRTAIIDCYAFLLLFPFAVRDAMHYNLNSAGEREISCILYYGIFVSFLSYILWFRGIEKVEAGLAGLFTSVVPVSSVLLSALFLKESIPFLQFTSLACILAGIWVSGLNRGREEAGKHA